MQGFILSTRKLAAARPTPPLAAAVAHLGQACSSTALAMYQLTAAVQVAARLVPRRRWLRVKRRSH